MLSFSLLILFIFSYFLHFTSRAPALGVMRFDLVLGGIILVLVLVNRFEDETPWRESTSRRLTHLFAYILLSLPLVSWPGSVVRFWLIDWIKVLMLFVFIVATVRSEKQLKWVLWVFLACQVFRIAEPVYLHVTAGYWGDAAYSMVGGGLNRLDRLGGAPHDIVNSNQLAWVVVTTVPFLYFLLWKGGWAQKVIAVAIAPLFGYCLVLTGSRSGLLSLLVVFLGIAFQSRRKVGTILLFTALLVPVGIWSAERMGTDLQQRYLSLVDSTVTGADTVQKRIDSTIRQLDSLGQNPLFGNGLGTSRETNYNVIGANAQITHNLYIEVLQELGLVGFGLFMLYVAAIIKTLREARKEFLEKNLENSWLCRMVTALQVWVFMDLFYSFSCFGLRSWEWYLFGGMAVVCWLLARRQPGEEVEVEEGRTRLMNMGEQHAA